MIAARDLHPISPACIGYHLLLLAKLGDQGDQIEAAVTAARVPAGDGLGAVFAPLIMDGAGGLRTEGPPADRLLAWLDGMKPAVLAAMCTGARFETAPCASHATSALVSRALCL